MACGCPAGTAADPDGKCRRQAACSWWNDGRRHEGGRSSGKGATEVALLHAAGMQPPVRLAEAFRKCKSPPKRCFGGLACVARQEGFEPPTYRFVACCSIQLGYWRARCAVSRAFARHGSGCRGAWSGACKSGAPGRIRTSDLQVRSLLLYPAGLLARVSGTLPERRAYRPAKSGFFAGAPGRIRTSDLQVRSLLLYPAGLLAQREKAYMPDGVGSSSDFVREMFFFSGAAAGCPRDRAECG